MAENKGRKGKRNKSAEPATAKDSFSDLPKVRSHGRSWMERHLWQIQPVRDVLLGASLFGVLYLGYVIRSITVPMLLALLLAYLTEPVVNWLIRKQAWITREIASVIILVAGLFVVVIPLVVASVVGVRQSISVTQKAITNAQVVAGALKADDPTEALAKIEQPSLRVVGTFLNGVTEGENRKYLGPVFEATWDLATSAEAWVKENAGTISKRVFGTGVSVFGKIVDVMTSFGLLVFTFFLTAFFFFFFSTRYGGVIDFWESLIPTGRRGRAIELARKMDRVVAGFVRGRLTICAIQSAVLVAGYWAIGVPSPLVLGLVVGALTIVPYASGIGIPIAIALMFFAPDHTGLRSETWWILLAPTLLYGFVQALDDYFLTPKIQGDATDLDTPTVLFASLAGGTLAGVYGLLLAIPVAACGKIIVKELVWPRVRAWAEGRTRDPLPLGDPVAADDD